MLTEKTFDTGTVRINYAEGPPAGMPLVMLHGATHTWQMFLPVLPWFLIRYHVHALDLRGHGRSGRVPGAYLISNFAEDVVEFLRDQVGEPAVLLGHSLGAEVSLVVAAQVPDLVRAVVLEDPPLATLSGVRDEDLEEFRRWRDVMTMEGTDEEKRAALAAQMTNADAVNIRRRHQQLEWCEAEILTNIIEKKMFEGYGLEDLLPQIACPVLLLQADPTARGRLEHQTAALASSLLADCAHVSLQNVGHNIHIAQPAAFSRIVTYFLETL